MANPPPSSDSFDVSFDPDSSRSSGKAVQLADGRFIVAWTDFGSGSADQNIGFRILNADCSFSSGNRIATGGMGGSQDGVSIAALAGGGFVLAWTNSNTATTGADVSYRVYNAAGVAVGNVITIETDSFQTTSSVVATASGGFIIGWQDLQTNDGIAQEFDSSGLALGSGPIRITDGAGFDSGPKFTTDGTNVVAAWSDGITGQPAGTGGIFSRGFSSFPTSDYTTEGDLVSDVDLSGNGRIGDVAISAGIIGAVWLGPVDVHFSRMTVAAMEMNAL